MNSNLDAQLIWESYRDNTLTFESIEDYDLVLKEHNSQLVQEWVPLIVGAATWGPRIFTAARAAMMAGRPIVTRMLGSQTGKKAFQQAAKKVTTPGGGATAVKELVKKDPKMMQRAVEVAKKLGVDVGKKVGPTAGKVADLGKAGAVAARRGAGELAKKTATGAGKAIKGVGKTAGQGMKKVGKSAGQGMKKVGGVIKKNPGKSLKYGAYGAGAYQAYDWGSQAIEWGKEQYEAIAGTLMGAIENFDDAVVWVQEVLGDLLDGASGMIETIAEFMVNTGVPILVILLLLYGGYKLLSWIFGDDDDEQPDHSRA